MHTPRTQHAHATHAAAVSQLTFQTLRAKWDAHHKLLGMSKGEAMQGYIDEIEAQKFKFDWTQYD